MLSICCSAAFRQVRRTPRPAKATEGPFARLLSTLVVLEQREGKLVNGSLGTVTAASKIGGSITGIVAGSGAKKVAEDAGKVKGLEKVIVVENGAYDKVCTAGLI